MSTSMQKANIVEGLEKIYFCMYCEKEFSKVDSVQFAVNRAGNEFKVLYHRTCSHECLHKAQSLLDRMQEMEFFRRAASTYKVGKELIEPGPIITDTLRICDIVPRLHDLLTRMHYHNKYFFDSVDRELGAPPHFTEEYFRSFHRALGDEIDAANITMTAYNYNQYGFTEEDKARAEEFLRSNPKTTPWEADDHPFWDSEVPQHMIGDIENALYYFLPDYCYLGGAQGDPACYGCWVDYDNLFEDISNGAVILAFGPGYAETEDVYQMRLRHLLCSPLPHRRKPLVFEIDCEGADLFPNDTENKVTPGVHLMHVYHKLMYFGPKGQPSLVWESS